MLFKRAFTLLEIILVIIMLGIVASLIVPSVGSYYDQAYKSHIKSLVKVMHKSLTFYQMMYQKDFRLTDYDSEGYPASSSVLVVNIDQVDPDLQVMKVQFASHSSGSVTYISGIKKYSNIPFYRTSTQACKYIFMVLSDLPYEQINDSSYWTIETVDLVGSNPYNRKCSYRYLDKDSAQFYYNFNTGLLETD